MRICHLPMHLRDDNAWTELVNAIRRGFPERLASRDALDLLESFKLDICEDSQTLDGAYPDKVREIFRRWVLSHGMEECPDSQQNAMFKDGTPDEVVVPRSPRYFYCIHVDAKALASIVASLSGANVQPYVNVVYGFHKFVLPPKVEGDEEYEEEDEPGYIRVTSEEIMPYMYGELENGATYGQVAGSDRSPPAVWLGGYQFAEMDK